jgi:hypothetical protein
VTNWTAQAARSTADASERVALASPRNRRSMTARTFALFAAQ